MARSQKPETLPKLPKAKSKEQKPIVTYGCPVVGQNQLYYERWAFLVRQPVGLGGLTRLQHFKNICEILFDGKIEWNEWLEKQINSLCENQWVAWPGCAGAGKTHGASLYATVWWLCAPTISSVILTSTTKGMIRKRAWPVIQKLHSSIPGPRIGNMVDSKTTWQSIKGDDKHAIFAIAVAEGSTAKAVANIQGVHTRRQLVIIDEATDTPEAAFEACANLYNSPEDFQLLVIGNPASHFDPMGKFCEPKRGWNSVTVEDDEWETIPQLSGKAGLVVRFDAEKSPNLKAGKTLYHYLVTESQLEGSRRKYGEKSPLFWKYQRGFWAPMGMKEAVLNETLIEQHHGTGKFIFIGTKVFLVANLDPAYGGGDRPILTFLRCGDISSSIMGSEIDEQIELNIDAASKDDIYYQLANQVKFHCEKRGVSQNRFGILVAGAGGGLADIIAREWGHGIIRIEEGGSASDTPLSKEDPRLCSDIYERKNVELWHMARQFLESGQLRGITKDVAVQMCNRELDLSHKKIKMQTKLEMKETFGRSPDHADSFVGALEVARRHGLVLQTVGKTRVAHQDWEKQVEVVNAVFENVDYKEEEVLEEEEALV